MLKTEAKSMENFKSRFFFPPIENTEDVRKWELPESVRTNSRLTNIVNMLNSSDSTKRIKGKSDLRAYAFEVWKYLNCTHQGFMRTDSGKCKREKYDTSSDLVAMALVMAYRKDIDGMNSYIVDPKAYVPSGSHGIMVWNHTLKQIKNADPYIIAALIIGEKEQEEYLRKKNLFPVEVVPDFVEKESPQDKQDVKVDTFKPGESPLIEKEITFGGGNKVDVTKPDSEYMIMSHEAAEKQFPRLKELKAILEGVTDDGGGAINIYYQELIDVAIGANVGQVIRVSLFDKDGTYMRDILVDPNTMYNGFSVTTADRNMFGMEDFVPLDEANRKKIIRIARGYFNTRDRKELMQSHTIPTNTPDVYKLVNMTNIRSLLPIDQHDWSKFINNLHSLCTFLRTDMNSCATILEYVSPVNFKIGVVETQDIKETSTITFNPEKYKWSEYKVEKYVPDAETGTK